jgi:hypothetical protein
MTPRAFAREWLRGLGRKLVRLWRKLRCPRGLKEEREAEEDLGLWPGRHAPGNGKSVYNPYNPSLCVC